MNVLTQIDIDIGLDTLFKYAAIDPNHSKFNQDGFKCLADKSLSMAQKVIKPAVAYDWYGCRVEKNELFCHNELNNRSQPLCIGSKPELLTQAKWILAGAATIGSELDKLVFEQNKCGDPVLAYLIDAAGVIALEQVVQKICCIAQDRARNNKWGVSPFLSPGSVKDWDLKYQTQLCRLVSIEKIGVSLNPAGMLLPVKSVTGVIGIGPHYGTDRCGSLCEICQYSDKCKHRKHHCQQKEISHARGHLSDRSGPARC